MQMQTKKAGETLIILNRLVSESCTGEVIFQSDDCSGKVYLYQGLVVWAFASGQKESFQSILLNEGRVSKESLVTGIQKSREQGKRNLDDILTDIGMEDEDLRREVISRHTRSALQQIRSWTRSDITVKEVDGAIDAAVKGFALGELIEEEDPVDLGALLENIRNDLSGFLATMVVDAKTGMPIATLSDADDIPIEIVSAFYRDVVKSAHEALINLGKAESSDNPIEEILLTGRTEHVLLRVLRGGEQVLYLLVDADANPGMAFIVIRRYLEKLEQSLS